MKNMKKRFVSLLVVFTSIISLLPVGFGGQVAEAATSDGTTVRVNVDGSKTPLTTRVDSSIDETIYTTENQETSFDITVEDVEKTSSELVAQAVKEKASITGITKQEIVITSINQVTVVNSDFSANTDGEKILDDMGVTIGYGTSDGSDGTDGPTAVKGDSVRIGAKISGLPLGVNKITYALRISTLDITYAETKNADGTTTGTGTPDPDGSKTKTKFVEDITIEHATEYLMNKIDKLELSAYLGDGDIADSETVKNNKVPFLYIATATPDTNMKLRYNIDLPDSISALKYTMECGDNLNLSSGVMVFKKGKELDESDYSLSGQTLSGDLKKSDDYDLIVIKVLSDDDSASTSKIEKSYAIEIRYNQVHTSEDYRMTEAGITKYDYENDDSVEAYVGKEFTVTEENGYSVYSGTITINKNANLISIDPTLVAGKDSVAYVVTNRYKNSGDTEASTAVSQLKKDGLQYVDFQCGSQENTIWIVVHPGKDGTVTDESTILAIYKLEVTVSGDDAFTMDLDFAKPDSEIDNNDVSDPYLTQTGVKDNDLSFSTSRRTYDLYYDTDDDASGSVKITLPSANRSSRHEYLKVWGATDKDSDSLTETDGSKALEYDSSATDDELYDNGKGNSVTTSLKGYEKIVVQAYYDEFTTETDPDDSSKTIIKRDSSNNPVYTSYALGEKYVFYIPANDDGSGTTTDTSSDNALLNSLKVKGQTLVQSDDTEGFSSSVYDYTVTVEKEDTNAIITAIAADENAESIVATNTSTKNTYDLVSSEASEIPLDTDGKTSIKIVVTAQDGTTTKTYTLQINNNTKSSDVTLSNVILSTGTYKFDSSVKTTKVHVSQSTTSIKVTPIPKDSNAVITVDGEEYGDNSITVSLRGSQETDIEIVVTSEDGTESKTYTLEVYRTDSSDWDDSSSDENDDGDDQYYDDYYDCWVDTTKYEEWGKVGSKPAYFDKNNRQVKDAWISTGGKLYYLNSSGYRASGWKVDEKAGKTYYLDPTTGELKKGWMNLNNSWYYLELNGVMHKGWLQLNKKWYYFAPNGQMVTNQSMYIDDQVCRFGQDGAMY